DGARDGYVHHVAEVRRMRATARPDHRRCRPRPILSRQAAKLEWGRLHGKDERRAARREMERLQDQLQTPAALPRPGTAIGLRPHYAPYGGSERARAGQPALRALVGDAACAPRCPGVRGKQKKRRAHPERIAAGFRAEPLRASLGSEGLRMDGGNATASAASDKPNCASMVWVPGGSFLMGSKAFYREERPLRRETVQGFWIDTHPVTN